MTNPFAVARKYLLPSQQQAATATGSHAVTVDLVDGDVLAVLINSPIVGPVWFAFTDDFKSEDSVPVFYASELPYLRTMSEAELRQRYEQKRIFGGGWIRNKFNRPTKH